MTTPGTPPPTSDPPFRQTSPAPNEQDADRRRMQQNLAAFLFVIVLVVFGTWLIDRLITYSRNMSCISSGQRSCR